MHDIGTAIIYFGALIVVVGIILLARQAYAAIQSGEIKTGLIEISGVPAPLVVIIVGVVLIWIGSRDESPASNGSSPTPAVPETSQPPASPTGRDGSTEPSCLPTHGTVTSVAITSPNDGAQVSSEFPMSGTWENVPPDQRIWIVNRGSDGLFYPQDGPIEQQADGEWQSILYANTGPGGEESDVGREFNYQAVVVPAAVSEQFRQLRSTPEGPRGVPELPAGTVVYDCISVIRI